MQLQSPNIFNKIEPEISKQRRNSFDTLLPSETSDDDISEPSKAKSLKIMTSPIQNPVLSAFLDPTPIAKVKKRAPKGDSFATIVNENGDLPEIPSEYVFGLKVRWKLSNGALKVFQF